ncbi:MAG: hypothetical protein H6936_05950 [Burkholderiales bacterium]|nr:hypothetical protein [Burkholderiales bacterium]
MTVEVIIFCVLVLAALYFFVKGKQLKRLAFIADYKFPSSLAQKVSKRYPHLTKTDINLVFDALRDYFHLCYQSKNKMVSMPSQVVDVAWHEFILFTRNYENFCNKALGKFLHHTPTEAMLTPTLAQTGIKRAWRLACAKEKISPETPPYLPLLFAIDSKLNIHDGFKYSLNCADKSSPNYGSGYCAAHIGCASGCSGDSGDASSGSGIFDGSGDSSGCSGGCGGD